MEVKIKQGEEMIDATIEMVDGVMVVSPKEVFEPKNGDVIVCSNNLGYWTLLVKRIEANKVVHHHAVLIDNGILKINDRSAYSNTRPATEEEKKLLFDRLAEEGWEWKADTKELVKLKWKPLNVNDMFDDYQPQESLLDGDFSCETTEDLYEPTDDELLYPSRHYDWVHDKIPFVEKPKIEVCDNGEICF